MNTYIIGGYNTKFGRLDDHNLYTLYEEAAKGAILDAQIETKDIDAVFIGNYSGGSFNNQEHLAPYGVNIMPELRHKPMYRLENACASGASAAHMAVMAIGSGMINTALVVGIEKMNSLDTKDVTKALAKASYWQKEGSQNYTFPGLFAEFAKGWMKKYDVNEETLRTTLAHISAKAYNFGAENPLAHIQKLRSPEEILNLPEEKNPMVAYPLRLHDCSLISDGAAAMVITNKKMVKNSDKAVEIAAIDEAADYLDIVNSKKSNHFLEGASVACERALQKAGMSINDIQVAEVHDCFTITELLSYSAIGLCSPGREMDIVASNEVSKGGRLVVNPSGGLKSKGHPVGATGASMHVMVYKQLCGEAIGYQVNNATNGLILNIGGSGASNIVSILKKA
ncbi:MAG: beta-ketoacyl synthase N-terminal-like domain-containing protein [Saprospiraceae bacterium]